MQIFDVDAIGHDLTTYDASSNEKGKYTVAEVSEHEFFGLVALIACDTESRESHGVALDQPCEGGGSGENVYGPV
jgi:hypothetical protein